MPDGMSKAQVSASKPSCYRFISESSQHVGNLNIWEFAINNAHKETSALLRSTQNIVSRKHHVPVHGVPSTAIIVSNYLRYDAKTSPDY